jgi:hypothetical protein
MNVALGQFVAMLANHRVQDMGESPERALNWVQERVTMYRGVYRAQGAIYGDDDDGFLRWLLETNPFGQRGSAWQASHN